MISFYILEAMRLIRRSSYGFFVLVFVTTLALAVSVLSLIVILESRQLSDRLKSGIEINIFLKEDLSEDQIKLIDEELKKNVAVKSTELVNKEKAVGEFIKETGEDFRQVLDVNPLPNSIRVVLKASVVDEKNLQTLAGNFKKIDGVTDVIYDYDTSIRLLRYLRISQYFIYPSAVLLILLSIYLVYSNNRIQIQQNSNLYTTMKLIGGKTNAIRIPILFNGIFVGLISGLSCIIAFIIIQLLLTRLLNSLKFTPEFVYIYGFILLLGVFLGFIGSYISSQRVVVEKK